MRKEEGMIAAEGLSKRFDSVLAVDRLSFSVRRGEVFGLLGPNGAGKTTTVRMLSALLAPSSGRAVVAGLRLGEDDQGLRKRMGVLPESPGFYPSLSAQKNLAFYGRMHRLEHLDQQVERYLTMLDLWERRHDPEGEFSRGMRQKLALARALLHEPRLLFLDEPASAFDPQEARFVRDYIEALSGEGRTIVLCTHNLEEADRLCDRVAVLKTRLLSLDTPEALRSQLFGQQVVFHLAQEDERFRRVAAGHPAVRKAEFNQGKLVVSLEDPEKVNPQLVEALVHAGARIQFVGELRPRLEDVYLELVSQAEGEDDHG